jgi:hypothetical protein
MQLRPEVFNAFGPEQFSATRSFHGRDGQP